MAKIACSSYPSPAIERFPSKYGIFYYLKYDYLSQIIFQVLNFMLFNHLYIRLLILRTESFYICVI